MSDLCYQVLTILQGEHNRFVSGEKIANQLNVSRSAVLKAVRSLQAEGYTVESVRRVGHRLRKTAQELNADHIRQRIRTLTERVIGVQTFNTIDSTNNEGKKLSGMITDPLLLVADEQTAGRGRQGHSFFSPAGTGLYMTVVVPARLSLSAAALCTQLMAVAALRAIDALKGPALSIKWVNDLYSGSKKVAGILTEVVTDLESKQVSDVVCGIGVNLTTEAFPSEIREKSASLGELDKNELAALITSNFLTMFYKLPDTSAWMEQYREHSMVLGRKLSFQINGVEYKATGKAIDDHGGLLVELDNGKEITLSSGEVSVFMERGTV